MHLADIIPLSQVMLMFVKGDHESVVYFTDTTYEREWIIIG